MVRQVFSINFLDAFIMGVFTVALPLLMLERGIDLAGIGLLFAAVPLSKILVRMASSVSADRVGEKVFYHLAAISNFAQAAAYALFPTAIGFGIGKFFDGARESFIWAVTRTSVIHATPHKGHFALGGLISGRVFYSGLGCLAIWLIYPIGGFELLFLMVGAVSLSMFLFSKEIKNTHAGNKVGLEDIKKIVRKKSYLGASFVLLLGSAMYNPLYFFILPIFFKTSGSGLGEIGIFYGAYSLLFGIVLNIISHTKIESEKTGVAGAAIFIISLCGMAFGPSSLMPYFFLFMALGDACTAILWEETIFLEARNSKQKSTEIALLHMPALFSMLFTSTAIGFVAERFGFAPVLIAGAASLSLFAFFGIRNIRQNRKE